MIVKAISTCRAEKYGRALMQKGQHPKEKENSQWLEASRN
jgi:hypothetical protein